MSGSQEEWFEFTKDEIFCPLPSEKSCLKVSWLTISLLVLKNSLETINLGRGVRDAGKWSSTKYCNGSETPFLISSISIEFLNLKIMLAKYLCEVILKIPKKINYLYRSFR